MGVWVYLNGDLIQRSKVKISALDYGFLYGFGLFETMRAYNGKVFRLEQHLKRLINSARVIDIDLDEIELRQGVLTTIRANKLNSARIRITITPGQGAINANLATCKRQTVLIIAEKYVTHSQEVYRDGFMVITSSFKCNSQSSLSRFKSTSYLLSVMAKHEARLAGADEAICLNEKGLLAEASMSNIFIVENGLLKTPGLESGILPGITRQTVLELASQMEIEYFEGDVNISNLYGAEEAFLTSSLLEIMPLTMVDNRCIGSGKVGDKTKQLIKAYKNLVEDELRVV